VIRKERRREEVSGAVRGIMERGRKAGKGDKGGTLDQNLSRAWAHTSIKKNKSEWYGAWMH
jgi:hypothetical protein